MRFFLDANTPRSAVAALVELGYEVEFSRDIGMANDRDEAIAARARETQAALVTRDLDLADIRRYPPSATRFTAHLAGRLAIVDDRRIRFRPAL
jgi:predicted nuclease of predicted toxin-antitoxin system